MLLVPGTKVTASFFTFGSTPPPGPNDPPQHPLIYYGSGEGKLAMASINAGNSQTLEVGLGGVNKQFRLDLIGAGQKNVNSGSDNYQTRHKKLLAKAGSGGSASESYQTDDPCVFSYVQASLVNNKAGWYEGICFVDIFSTKLCPAGNPLNAAMVYAAPPNGDNYANEADFLAAIQAIAVNIIKALAGYNAIAQQQKLPVIQALRNTLFSSGIYNRSQPNTVDPDKIARAILAGFQSELQAQDAGLVELQFPVGRGAQDLLFGPVQDDLTQAPAPGPVVNPGPGANPGRAPIGNMMPGPKPIKKTPPEGAKPERNDNNDDDDGDGVEMQDMGDQSDSDTQSGQVVVESFTGQQGQQQVANELATVNQELAGGQEPGNYGQLPVRAVDEYDQPDDPGLGPAQAAATSTNAAPVAQSTYDVVNMLEPGGNPVDKPAAKSASQNDASGYDGCTLALMAFGGFAQYAVVIGGAFLWAFVFGGGRKYVGSGIGRFEASDQTVSANDLDATVDVDLISLNGLILISDITFSSPASIPTQAPAGSWSVTPATHAQFTPGAVGAYSSVSVTYVLVAVAIPGSNAQTDPQTLTVNFNPTPAVDILVTANDRISQVPIDISTQYTQFAGTITLMNTTGGTWILDPITKYKVTYKPDSTLTGTTATASYVRVTTWGVPSAAATITINLPAATVPSATGTAEFLSNDTQTQGDWLPVYGAEGYVIAGDQTSNPSYVTPSIAGPPAVSTFTNTSAEALVKASSPATRVAAAWSAASPIVIDLNCNDTVTVHQVALYWADYDPKAAGQTVEVLDANGIKLATQTLPATFTGGLYLVCNISGHVKISISNVAGNAILSGIFFGGPTVTATFVKSDRVTQGSWLDLKGKQVYGADGYSIAPDSAQTPNLTKNPSYLPSGPTVTALTYDFASEATNGTEAGRLQLPSGGTGSLASVWYQLTGSAITIDLPFADSAAHQVALYFWDYDQNRDETIQVLDAAGTVLGTPQKLSSFGTGAYLIWKIAGHVTISITSNTTGNNLVLSGIFFDAPPTTTLMFAAVSAAPVAYDFTVWLMDAPQSVKLDFLKHCQIPAGFKAIELSNGSNDVTVPKEGRWSLEAAKDILFEPVVGLALAQPYSMKYCVVDQHGAKSNIATMTVDYTALPMLMPRAANFLSSAKATYGKFAAADVLTNSSAYFGIKKGSVALVGVQDVLQGNPTPNVYVRNDGRAMSVQGEGMWMVDDYDKIVFQSDANSSLPPTPALYQFSDNKGYQSNSAVVLFDSDAAGGIAKTPAILAKLTDAQFWQNYIANVSGASTDLRPEQFVAVTQALAVVTRTQGSVGPDPFAQSDIDTNYNNWGGGKWSDLQTACAKMTATAVPSSAPQYAARYWQLNLMVRMAVKAFPPS